MSRAKLDNYILFSWINGFLRFLIYRSTIFILICISILSAIFYVPNNKIITNIRSSIIQASAPIIIIPSKFYEGALIIKEKINEHFDVHKKNQLLITENEYLKSEKQNSELIYNENKLLKNLLKLIEHNYKIILSTKIIARSNGNMNKSLIIPAGSDKEIKPAYAAINNLGLVGRVIEVNEKTSRILSINDINSKIPVISMENRERALAVGNGTNNLELLYLNEDHKIYPGEIFITEGDGEFLPTNLFVGIAEINAEGKIFLAPFANLNKIDYISLLAPDNEK